MKKIISTLLVVTMLLMLFVGCTKKEEEPAKSEPTATTAPKEEEVETPAADLAADLSGTITIITHRTDLLLEDAPITMMDYVEKFNQVYPNVKVEFEGITDYEGQIRIRMNTEEYGDVLMIPKENFPISQLPNFFEPLGTYDELSQKYLFMNDSKFDNNCYGIPTVINAQGVLYNTEVWGAAGITQLPSTPEEYISDLQLVKDKTDAIPFYTNYAAGWPLGGQYEAEMPSVGGSPDWYNTVAHTDAPWSEGEPYYIFSKLLYDIVKGGLSEEDPTTTDWEGSKIMLAKGEISSMLLGSWSIIQMQQAAESIGLSPDVIGYMPFPYTNADGKVYAASGGDYNLGINKYSKNKEAAKAWIDWFTNESNFAADQGGISPVMGADMPATLKGFQDLGVIFIGNNPAPEGEETLLDEVDAESEIGRWSEAYRLRIVEAAIGNRDESLEDIMADLNSKWSAARKALGLN